jgi:hypothetical protein
MLLKHKAKIAILSGEPGEIAFQIDVLLAEKQFTVNLCHPLVITQIIGNKKNRQLGEDDGLNFTAQKMPSYRC